MCFNVNLLLKANEHDRIIVSNDPVNWIDPEGLVNWSAVRQGAVSIGAGMVGVGGGALASGSGLGAVVGIPTAIAGAGTFAWGMSQLWLGILENDNENHIIPPASATGLATLALTGDVCQAANNDALADILLAGAGATNGLLGAEAALLGASSTSVANQVISTAAQTAAGVSPPLIHFNNQK